MVILLIDWFLTFSNKKHWDDFFGTFFACFYSTAKWDSNRDVWVKNVKLLNSSAIYEKNWAAWCYGRWLRGNDIGTSSRCSFRASSSRQNALNLHLFTFLCSSRLLKLGKLAEYFSTYYWFRCHYPLITYLTPNHKS